MTRAYKGFEVAASQYLDIDWSYATNPILRYAREQVKLLETNLHDRISTISKTLGVTSLDSLPSYNEILINRIKTDFSDTFKPLYDFEAYLQHYQTSLRIGLDTNLSIEQKAQAVDRTAQKLYLLIEQRYSTSSNVDFFNEIVTSLTMLTHFYYDEEDRYKKQRYDRLKYFLFYLEKSGMNWIEDDEDGFYYIDLYELIELFFEGVESFERYKQKYIELSTINGRKFALDPHAETNIQIIRNVHPFMWGRKVKKRIKSHTNGADTSSIPFKKRWSGS